MITLALKNLRSAAEFDNLAETIRNVSAGKELIYVPNRGNWGDGLIHQGTRQFLKANRIAYREVIRGDMDALVAADKNVGIRHTGAVLLAGGGGAWCKNYPGSRNLVRDAAHFFDHIVVLPTTYELEEVALEDRRVTYFRRDKFQSADTVTRSRFCHDMAFFLDVDVNAEPSAQEGNFFREDREANKEADRPAGNIDLSRMGKHTSDIRPFFTLLSKHRSVRTDRMHVSIASSLLGINCTLYPGNYFKSSAVFKSSIEPNFSTCKLGNW